jgi:hypothetical protein
VTVTTLPTSVPSNAPSQTNAGAVAAGVVGGAVGLAIIAILLWFVMTCRAQHQPSHIGKLSILKTDSRPARLVELETHSTALELEG